MQLARAIFYPAAMAWVARRPGALNARRVQNKWDATCSVTEVGGCEVSGLGCSGSPVEVEEWDTGVLGGELASLLWWWSGADLIVFMSRCLLEKWPCPGPLSLSLQGSTAEDRELTAA